jgi:exonuclease SbcC
MIAMHLYAEDLYSFENLELDFSKFHTGVTAILGKNIDMNSDNGAGKSAIIRIIYYALYGKDLKGASVDKIIRRNSKGGSLVIFTFKDGDNIFKIQRYRGYKKESSFKNGEGKPISGTGVDFFINNNSFSIEKDPKKTESIIQSRIKTSDDMFKNSVLTEQKRKYNFLESEDSKKKEILIELLSLDYYELAQKFVKDDIEAMDVSFNNTSNKIDLYKNQLGKKNNELKELNEKLKKYEEDASNSITTLEIDINNLKNQLPLLQKEYLEIKDNKKSISELKDSLQLLENENQKNKDAILNEKIIIQKESEFKNNIENSKKQIEDILKENIELNNNNKRLKKEFDLFENFIDYSETILQLKRNIDKNLIKIKQFETDLNKKESINKKKANGETIKSENQKIINNLIKDIEEIKHNMACSECLRPFIEGQSKSFDDLLIKKNSEIESKNKENEIINKQLDDINNILQKLEKINTEYLKIIDENKKYNETLNEFLLKNEKQEAEKKSKELINNQININKTKINNNSILIKSLEDKIIKNEKNINELDDIKTELKKIKTNYEELSEKINNLKTQISNIQSTNQNIDLKNQILTNTEKSLNEKKSLLKNYKEYKNPYISLENKCINEISELNTELVRLNTKLTDLNEEKLLLNFWKSGFSKTGIISFITEDVIKFLNSKIKEYLDFLSDGTLSLEFSPESKLQKGSISNKIETKMWINGEESLEALNSGGELQRFILAVDLALSDMVESRSPVNFNIKFLDEPFDGIDSSGQIKALMLFKKMADLRNGFFVISHDKDMQNFCDNAIYVIKKNDISKIVDKETYLSYNEI